MTRLKLCLQLVAHRLVGEQIVTLAGKEPAHCYLVILIRLDSELTPVMAVGNQRLVKLLNRERRREIFRVAVPDVADKAMKYAI
jgi:hypothetical protein